tara:strand:+ start:456 stop:638 length:183 start_codon:yes stop_codon:yes gene_type:complete
VIKVQPSKIELDDDRPSTIMELVDGDSGGKFSLTLPLSAAQTIELELPGLADQQRSWTLI